MLVRKTIDCPGSQKSKQMTNTSVETNIRQYYVTMKPINNITTNQNNKK